MFTYKHIYIYIYIYKCQYICYTHANKRAICFQKHNGTLASQERMAYLGSKKETNHVCSISTSQTERYLYMYMYIYIYIYKKTLQSVLENTIYILQLAVDIGEVT